MTKISSILAVYDPTRKAALREQPAVGRATDLAAALGARLELFLCDYNQYLSGERFFDSPGLSKARDSYIAGHLKLVNQVAKEVREHKVEVTTKAVWDTPLSDGIVRRVLQSSPDLVVKDTHPHAKLQRVIFTNTDWHLIRDCPAPLLLVKPGEGNDAGPVIAAVDPMHDNDKPAQIDQEIIGLGRALSDCQKLGFHLFHAYHTIVSAPSGVPTGVEPVILPLEMTDESIKKAHARAFNALREKFGVPEDHAHLMQGDTRESLFELVDELKASLVVMGAVARGRLQRLFVGSTAEKVLGDVQCDVLVVKPEGFKSSVKA